MIDKKKLDYFGELVTKHIDLYPKLSLKAEQFESLFSKAIKGEWNPYNHNTSEDMITEIKGLKKPSLKSGQIEKGFLKISSHRTTKYKTLEDKINFLKTREYDSFICLSRSNKKKPHYYKLIYFDKNIIDYDSLKWEVSYNKKGKQKGWFAKNNDSTIIVEIIKSMSDQVWIQIDLNKVKILREYDFEK